eukprot:TRINITY_DN3071_c0_g1_i4.p1 TRINITY_DN3071_c0_g1~~TRINITY_DN3071_c0_g1_i4.p1  ORF type:complete len:328 (+),score=35.79 TRINITY_DN3071_c0_g1_i4:128-1111(+)
MATLQAPRLLEFLHKTLVQDVTNLKGPQRIVEVTTTQTLREVLQVLSTNKILSVPVRDELDREYVGFIDVLDVVTKVLLTYSEGEDVVQMQWSAWCQDIDTLTHRGEDFGNTLAINVLNLSKSDKWCPVDNGTLFQLVEVFAQGIHRVPILSPHGAITSIISQSDVLSVLHKLRREEKLFSELENKTLIQLGIGKAESVVTMSINAQAIHAFWCLYFNKVSAVAIVDPQGRLLGNISASDIRGIGGARRFSTLLLPIGEFCQLEGPDFVRPAIHCTQNSTLGFVIEKLVSNRIHRIWVVEDKKPIGLVSLTDVMKLLVKLEPPPLNK